MLAPLVMLLLVCFLVLSVAITVGAVGEASGLALFQPHAIIRLSPDVKLVQQPVVVLVTSDSRQATGSVRLHQWAGTSSDKQVSVPATGIQTAQVAHGILSFYNQSDMIQTVAAGTTYTGRDGMMVGLDTEVHVPPWTSDGGMGSTTARAHAMTQGAIGNIAPGDIVGCCGSNGLLIKNAGAFSGGKDAATIITAQDIEKVRASLQPSQRQAAMQALQVQMSSDDQQLGTPICTPTVQSNHQVGSVAASVDVTVRVACQEQTYSRHEVKHQIGVAFTSSQVVRELGVGYKLQGQPSVDMMQAHITRDSITVPAHGTFVYQLDFQAIQQQVSTKLSGTTMSDAHALLAGLPGVSTVEIQVTGGWNSSTLPTDTSNIEIVEAPSTK